MDEIVKEYRERGYAKIPGVFTKQETDRIRLEAYWLYRVFKEKKDSRLQMFGLYPALLFWPNDLSDYLKEITNSPDMRGIVSEFLGDSIYQLNNQIYFRESGDGDQFGWHQDISFRTPPEEFENIEESYLQTIICVDDMDDNGAIEFIPGSHLWGNQNLIPRDNSEIGLRKFERGSWKGEKVKAKSGDVLVWSVMVVHGSEPNISGRSRMNFMNGFAKQSAVKVKGKFPVYAIG